MCLIPDWCPCVNVLSGGGPGGGGGGGGGIVAMSELNTICDYLKHLTCQNAGKPVRCSL